MSLIPFTKISNCGPSCRRGDNLLDNLFGSSWLTPFESIGKQWKVPSLSPLSDISETKSSYQISVELPGLKEEDIDINLDGDILHIKGEKKLEETKEERNYYYSERSYGSFERSIKLPENAKVEDISAVFNHGVLSISIPKKSKTPSAAKRVPINKKR